MYKSGQKGSGLSVIALIKGVSMNKTGIHITEDELGILKQVCARRNKTGNKSLQDVFADMKKFVNEELGIKWLNENSLSKMTEQERTRIKQRYEMLKNFKLGDTYIKSAFKGEGDERNLKLLREIANEYIAEFEHLTDLEAESKNLSGKSGKRGAPAFSKTVENELLNSVNSMCSFPNCYKPTKAPSLQQPGEFIILGRACMIYGKNPRDARYDPKVEIDFYGKENGIWLCSTHADFVEHPPGILVTAAELIDWRRKHEILLYEKVTGMRSVNILGFSSSRNDRPNASALLNHFRNTGFLFTSQPDFEPDTLIAGIRTLQTFLKNELSGIKYSAFLSKQIAGVIYVCDGLLRIMAEAADTTGHWSSFLVFRKIAGEIAGEIAEMYSVDPGMPLGSIIPEKLPPR
jgi:hypothetical protein